MIQSEGSVMSRFDTSSSSTTPKTEHASSSPPTGNGQSPPPTDALKDALGHLGELRAYATHYLVAKADRIKLSIRNLGVYAALGVLGLIIGSATIATAVVLLLVGIAGGLSALMDAGLWAGSLIVGGVIVLGLVGAMIWFLKWFPKATRARTVQKYEDKRRQQQADFGHDVHERAREEDRSKIAGQ